MKSTKKFNRAFRRFQLGLRKRAVRKVYEPITEKSPYYKFHLRKRFKHIVNEEWPSNSNFTFHPGVDSSYEIPDNAVIKVWGEFILSIRRGYTVCKVKAVRYIKEPKELEKRNQDRIKTRNLQELRCLCKQDFNLAQRELQNSYRYHDKCWLLDSVNRKSTSLHETLDYDFVSYMYYDWEQRQKENIEIKPKK